MLFNNYDSCSIYYNPQLCYSFGSFILYLFIFPSLISFATTLSLECLDIQKKSQHVTRSNQLMAPFPLCVLHINEVMRASCATSWLHELDLEDFGFLALIEE
jgi:hypothetical protein